MKLLSVTLLVLWGLLGCVAVVPHNQRPRSATGPRAFSSPVPPALPATVQQALQDYEQGQYEKTVMLGKQFLRHSPQVHEAGFVQYLIGEALYEQRQYEAAVVAFDAVVQKFPQDPKVSMALLKTGVAFAALHDLRNAQFFLRSVQKKFPTSPEAQWAALPPEQLLANRHLIRFTPQAMLATPPADLQPAPSMPTASSAQPSPTASARPATANRMLPLSSLRKECIQFSKLQAGESIKDCRVSEVGKLGTIHNKTYYYALYCVVSSLSLDGHTCSPNQGPPQAVAIFVQDGSATEVRLMMEDSLFGPVFSAFEKPAIIRHTTHVFLEIFSGMGQVEGASHYLLADGEWHDIDGQALWDAIKKRIPAHLQGGFGPKMGIDIRRMTAEVLTYRENDPHCCPTGDIAHVKLAVKNKQFVMQSMTMKPSPTQANKQKRR